jgi:hypothetical protein
MSLARAKVALQGPADTKGVVIGPAQVLRIGGVVSGIVLVAFGIAVIVLAVWGHNQVTTELKRQQITGTPDMNPTAIKEAAEKAGLQDVTLPTCDVAGEKIDTGSEARCFGQYMNVHALEATGGYVYSQMGRFAAKPDAPKSELAAGGGTDNPEFAEIDSTTNQPVANGARNIWVTETALATALNVSYMASALSLFSLVVGIALLLAGIGFIVLALGALSKGSEKQAGEQQPAPAS